MAHFAEIDSNNLVMRVLVVDNEHEANGQHYLAEEVGLGGKWIQTSYNTYGGEHKNGGTPLRKNYAGIGFIYDEEKDAFIPPKPYTSWILNEETCLWEAPIPYPLDENAYVWDEMSLSWTKLML